MFKRARYFIGHGIYLRNLGLVMVYHSQLLESLQKGENDLVRICCLDLLKHGRKAIEIGETIGVEGDSISNLRVIVSNTKKISADSETRYRVLKAKEN